MTGVIQVGTILMKETALVPECLRLDCELYAEGWRAVNIPGGQGADRALAEAGWTFSGPGGEIQASVLALNRVKAVKRAVKRLLARLEAGKSNSLEITRIAARRMLGPLCVTVSAHARHIQQGRRGMVRMPAGQSAERDPVSLPAV